MSCARCAELEAEIERLKNKRAFALKGPREQRVYTPQSIIDCLLEIWPEIALDPCSGSDSLVPAKEKIEPPGDGLAVEWVDHTYVNPPYDQLRAWMRKAADSDAQELCMLIPNRTHRDWFRDLRPLIGTSIELRPLKFVGYKAPFPTPLVILYRGRRVMRLLDALARRGLT